MWILELELEQVGTDGESVGDEVERREEVGG